MGRTYALVILCHATVIAILWWFGRPSPPDSMRLLDWLVVAGYLLWIV